MADCGLGCAVVLIDPDEMRSPSPVDRCGTGQLGQPLRMMPARDTDATARQTNLITALARFGVSCGGVWPTVGHRRPFLGVPPFPAKGLPSSPNPRSP